MTHNIQPCTPRAARAQAVLAALLVSWASAASAGSACSAPGPEAAAADGAASRQAVRVSYADLNLATESGARALSERLTQAARKVCAAGDIRDLVALAQSASCARAAVAAARAQVPSAPLAARSAPGAQRS